MEIQHDSTWIGTQNRWNWVNHGNPTVFRGYVLQSEAWPVGYEMH